MTGFSCEVRELITTRARGLCERCGYGNSAMQHHHRRPRGMGGSSRADTNSAANGVLLCAPCHQTVESHRTEGLLEGWLLLQIQNPLEIPVLRRGVWTFLLDDGTYETVAAVG